LSDGEKVNLVSLTEQGSTTVAAGVKRQRRKAIELPPSGGLVEFLLRHCIMAARPPGTHAASIRSR
jgi:hypothetical protein